MTVPLISILVPVYDPPAQALVMAVHSVVTQNFASWELVLVDDGAPSARVRTALRKLAKDEPRIRLLERASNGGIVAASRTALEAARGTFIALLDHDDMLARGALRAVADAIEAEPEVDYLYTDEDKVSESGERYDEFRKPDWSPERLRGQMYTGHLSVLRTSLVREVGGFVADSDGSQDHDLVLRVTERARTIVHLPVVAYHWRAVRGSAADDAEAKPYAWTAGLAAVKSHLRRSDINATVVLGPRPGTYLVQRKLSPDVSISIIIPTRGSSALVWGERRTLVIETVRSVIKLAGRSVEIVVVYDDATPQAVLDGLRAIAPDRLVLVPFHEPFNFSAKCNQGYLASSGEVVIFMNDDMEAVTPGFAEQLAAPLFEPGVGATGARLLFADGSLQHGGHVYAAGDLTHAGFRGPGDDEGPFRAYLINREVSGLTAACIALRRATFEEVGGFCEELPGNFNDVDLSRKIRSLGHRMLWLAGVTLFHFESLTRDSSVQQWEYDFIMRRWGTPERDPYLPAYRMAT